MLVLISTLPLSEFAWRLLSPPPRVFWNVSVANRRTDEVHHVVFAKVHKAASSTLYSIFVRFAISRDLNVMFPRDGHILSEGSSEMGLVVDHPPSPPFLFDMLCSHLVFDEDKVRPHFPMDTVFIAVVRDPWTQMQSAYHYYRNRFHRDYLTHSRNLTDFLTNRRHYEPQDVFGSFTNNRMSIDLGLPVQQIGNASYVTTFLQHVDKVFDLVLITERFDESMILLRRRLGWTMKDVMNVKLNRRELKNRWVADVAPSLKAEFQQFNRFDVALYDYFSKAFEQKVLIESAGFEEEVRTFGSIQERIQSFCDYYQTKGNLTIPKTKWNEEFMFKAAECETLAMEEIVLDYRAKYWQQARMMG